MYKLTYDDKKHTNVTIASVFKRLILKGLTEIRKKHNYDLEILAQDLRITEEELNYVENGAKVLSFSKTFQYAKALNADIYIEVRERKKKNKFFKLLKLTLWKH